MEKSLKNRIDKLEKIGTLKRVNAKDDLIKAQEDYINELESNLESCQQISFNREELSQLLFDHCSVIYEIEPPLVPNFDARRYIPDFVNSYFETYFESVDSEEKA